MAAPDEPEFAVYARGEVRDDIILASFRNDLRALRNPDTGLAFTEDEIARATQPGSRFYVEADAIDLYGQAMQARAQYLADQVDPRRANGAFLRGVHGELWLGPDSMLPADGASGAVLAKGTPGSVYPGNPSVPNATAAIATDANGLKYQVLAGATVGADGTVEVQVKAVDAGAATNLAPGSLLRWSANAPLSADPNAVVLAVPGDPANGLTGGVDAETEQQYQDRIAAQILAKPASGNAAHFQAWGRRASPGVERCFTYACALHAGSTVCAPTQRRTGSGPLARLPSVGVLSAVQNYIVPPYSPVVPERVFVLIVSPRSQPVDLVVRLAMAAGVGGGWFDVVPWPAPPLPPVADDIEQVQITAILTPLSFTVETASPLPANSALLTGLDAPQLMVWDDGLSRFERLLVDSVAQAGTTATITLLAAPQKVLAVGDRISPYTDRLLAVALAHEQYFDALGPGELVGPNDERAARAARRPLPQQEFAQRAGQSLVSVLVDSLGGTAADADLTHASRTSPDLPGAVGDGPNMLTLGKLNLYPL